MDSIMKELEEEKSARIELSKQLEKANETIMALQASLTAPRSESMDSVEFSGNAGPSSTQHQDTDTRVEMSRFMTSMNQMSITSINVPECKSAVAGEQVGRRDYESWIDLFTDSLKLAGVEDERTRFIVFKVKAGPVLLDIFKNTKSTPEAPDEEAFPFSNATFRLKTYFGSASDIMLQRRKLALITQRPDESDLSFIMRVGSTARLCDFQEGKEFEEVVSAVAAHARNKDVRTAALKMLSRQGSFTDLVDMVREIEAVAMNEEYYRLKHGKPEQLAVAAVSAPYPRAGPSRRGTYRQPVTRGRYGHPYIAPSRIEPRLPSDRKGFGNAQEAEPYRCYRCNSIYHKADVCFAIDKICLKCGRKGHIQRACRPPIKTEHQRRTEGENPDIKIGKIASIDADTVAKAEEKADDENVGVDTAM